MAAVLAGLLLLSNLLISHPQDINVYSRENILKFAEYLYQEGDYLRAAGEYQRYLFASDKDTDKIFYKIGMCFQLAKHYWKSRTYFRKVTDQFNLSIYRDQAIYQIAKSYFMQKHYDETIAYSSSSLNDMASAARKQHLHQLVGLSYIYQKEWSEALSYLQSIEAENRQDPLQQRLVEIAMKGKNLAKKNRLLAGILSAVIPGAGKWYARRPSDALVSFLTVGLTAWQAVEGFNEKGVKSVKGWIYGTLGVFFYLGNIYGSIVAVNIYNKGLEDNHLKEVGVSLRVFLH